MTSVSESRERDVSWEAMRQELSAGQLAAQLTDGASGDARWLQLPTASGAEYRWSLWFYANGERHIYATLWPEPPGTADDDAVVWYHPFELEDYHESAPELEAAFRSEVRRLVRRYTRIRRRRLLVNWSVELESSHDGSSWERVYGFRALRAGRTLVRTENDVDSLSSPPLVARERT